MISGSVITQFGSTLDVDWRNAESPGVARLVLKIESAVGGTYRGTLSDVSAAIANVYAIDDPTAAPSASWDLALQDDVGNAYYTNAAVSSPLAAAVFKAACGPLKIIGTNMGDAKRATIVVTFIGVQAGLVS